MQQLNVKCTLNSKGGHITFDVQNAFSCARKATA